MKRHNIFHLIHKGLRAALYDTAWKLQLTDFTDASETENSFDRVREVLLLMDQHSRKLAGSILPLFDQYEPSVAACMGEEHQALNQLAQQLSTLLDGFRKYTTDAEKQYGGRRVTDAFIEYMVINLRRMGKEEGILHQILSRYYSADEIRDALARTIGTTPPWIQDFYAKWMLRGLNDAETASWLKATRNQMPGIVFQTLYSKAGQELNAQRFQKLASELAPAS